MLSRAWTRITVTALVTTLAMAMAAPASAAGTLPAAGDWLGHLNAFRATAGLAAAVEEPAWSEGNRLHGRYMTHHRTVTHSEDQAKAYYTQAGHVAAKYSNLSLVGGGTWTPAMFVQGWMRAPFHAAGMLNPHLTRTGYGQFTMNGYTGAGLDTLRGYSRTASVYPDQIWPGDGATVPLKSYPGGEYPDPLVPCSGYTAPTGLPLLAFFDDRTGTDQGLRSASLTVASGPDKGVSLDVCAYDGGDHPHSVAKSSLRGTDGVLVIPRKPLVVGTSYTVDVRLVDGRRQTSTFAIGTDYKPAGTGVSTDGATGFSDTRGHMFEANIAALAESGITKGCGGTKFCPNTYVTRGQMAAFLDRALNLPNGTATFSDSRGHMFEANIAALAKSGITKGCGGTKFCPDTYVTRGQMAAFLDRALNLPNGTATFSDSRGHMFEANIAALAKSGITKGCGGTKFCPNTYVTRGQMAAFLDRAGLTS